MLLKQRCMSSIFTSKLGYYQCKAAKRFSSAIYTIQENLVKNVYKQFKDGYTYKRNKKLLRRSNEMIIIVKSMVVTTSSKMKITHSTRSEWIA